MPIKQAAMKALRQAQTRTKRNDSVRENLAYMQRMLRKAIEANNPKEAEKLLKETVRSIDKAMQKKVIKKNTGARMKSRLTIRSRKAAEKK
jgi:small subunit ribosomal protein S20